MLAYYFLCQHAQKLIGNCISVGYFIVLKDLNILFIQIPVQLLEQHHLISHGYIQHNRHQHLNIMSAYFNAIVFMVSIISKHLVILLILV